MSAYVAKGIAVTLSGRVRGARLLVLGLTFKENIPDLRNSKVADLVNELRAAGCTVEVHDAHADAAEAKEHYGISLQRTLDGLAGFDGLIGAVAHDEYRALRPAPCRFRTVGEARRLDRGYQRHVALG